jgi:hypothetical protein
VRCASRINEALFQEIEAQARKNVPIAEISRRIGRFAEKQGLPPPSYERVRILVHASRRLSRQSTSAVLLDVALGASPPDALVEHLSGTRTRRT